ncbi:MAG: C2H2-type zinc finger protein [Candidatus Babeliales bacterium]|nr:C2H2-type zinc finger protein [Candidatus Babeliales bacterium]
MNYIISKKMFEFILLFLSFFSFYLNGQEMDLDNPNDYNYVESSLPASSSSAIMNSNYNNNLTIPGLWNELENVQPADETLQISEKKLNIAKALFATKEKKRKFSDDTESDFDEEPHSDESEDEESDCDDKFSVKETKIKTIKHVAKKQKIEENEFENDYLSEPKEEKKFKCIFPICGKSFDKLSNFKRHQLIHAPILNSFKCEFPKCEKTFSRKDALQEHYKIHTGKKFKCNQCNKEYSSSPELKKHNRIHTGETFNCDQCDKVFTRKSHLRNHIMVHTGEKPFKCEQCNKAFRKKSNLKTHNKKDHPVDNAIVAEQKDDEDENE